MILDWFEIGSLIGATGVISVYRRRLMSRLSKPAPPKTAQILTDENRFFDIDEDFRWVVHCFAHPGWSRTDVDLDALEQPWTAHLVAEHGLPDPRPKTTASAITGTPHLNPSYFKPARVEEPCALCEQKAGKQPITAEQLQRMPITHYVRHRDELMRAALVKSRDDDAGKDQADAWAATFNDWDPN